MAGRFSKFWALVAVLLAVSIVAGGIVLRARLSPEPPIEISNPQVQQWQGQIYVGGAVNTPGYYPMKAGDSIDSLLRAAGGASSSANMSGLELHVPDKAWGTPEEGQGQQKIDINRADARLLESLPAIGEALARRIIDYRQQNGLFKNTEELLKVPGIGTSAYAKIKELITVADR